MVSVASIAIHACGPGLRVTLSNGARQTLLADVRQALTQDQALRPPQPTPTATPVQISQMGIAALTVARVSGPGLRMTHSNGAQRTLLADVKQALALTLDQALLPLQTTHLEMPVQI